MNEKERAAALREEIERLKKEKGAVIMAHYYQRKEIQEIADFIGDSLALAQQAAKTDARVILMCGVHFMGDAGSPPTAPPAAPGSGSAFSGPRPVCFLSSWYHLIDLDAPSIPKLSSLTRDFPFHNVTFELRGLPFFFEKKKGSEKRNFWT